MQKKVQEATQLALRDEISVVEKQREAAMAHIESWLREVHSGISTR